MILSCHSSSDLNVVFTRGGNQAPILKSGYVFLCCSSWRETISWLVNNCPHASKTFDRMQCIRETIAIISHKTMPMAWRVPLSQGPHHPNQLESKKARNDPIEGNTSLIQVGQFICFMQLFLYFPGHVYL